MQKRGRGISTWTSCARGRIREGRVKSGDGHRARDAEEQYTRIGGPRGVYRKIAEVGEGKQTAAALLWSRQGGGHYELL